MKVELWFEERETVTGAMSRFHDVPQAREIEVFAVGRRYNEDPAEVKVNLSVGAYRDDDGKPWVLPVVRQVESLMAADSTLNHEYLPVAGLPSLRDAAVKLVLGADSPALVEGRAFGVQSLSGTGSLRIGAEFLKRFGGVDTVMCSSPTWGNHNTIFKDCKYAEVLPYRYYDSATRGFDFRGMVEDLEAAKDGAVVVLHGCCHNPTGVDPSLDQWREILHVMKKKNHFCFFDCAYLGFASGNVDLDAEPVRLFVKEGVEMFIAMSFAKNFGLYNERAGCLAVVTADPSVNTRMLGQFELVVRAMYSNPPNHGARIVATVLNNDTFHAQWRGHVKTIAERVLLMRKMLHEKLLELGTPGSWRHVVDQKGMFTYTGLEPHQVAVLTEKFHIYLLSSGRINMAGLNTKNVEYVAEAIHAVCTVDCKCS